MNLRNKYTIAFVYWLIRILNKFSRFIEAKIWGFEWCKLCCGESIYPLSGIWIQPDGYMLCPRCLGDRWEHVAEVHIKCGYGLDVVDGWIPDKVEDDIEAVFNKMRYLWIKSDFDTETLADNLKEIAEQLVAEDLDYVD